MLSVWVFLSCVMQRSSYLRLQRWGLLWKVDPGSKLLSATETNLLLTTIMLLVQNSLSSIFPSLNCNRVTMRARLIL